MSRMDVQISSCEHNLVHSVQSIHHSEQCLEFLHLGSNSFGTLHIRTAVLMMAEFQQQQGLAAVTAFSATSPGWCTCL